MDKFILRTVIHGFGLYAAIGLIDGIVLQNPDPITYVWLALIFTILNTILKPVLKFVTCPFILLTLGLFTLIINTILFTFTGWIGRQFDVGFILEGNKFWAAFLGAFIVSIISMIFEAFLKDELKGKKRRR